MRLALRLIASLALGVFLLFPLGALYGIAGLPVYHSWGLVHGSFMTALPALIAVSFVLLGAVPFFGPSVDLTPRLIAGLAVLPLVTVLFWVNQSVNHALFSVRHAIVYASTFFLLAALCIKSTRPTLVPLFLLVPVLIDPLFGLFIVGFSESTGLQMFAFDFVSEVLPVLVASVAAVVLARYVRESKA